MVTLKSKMKIVLTVLMGMTICASKKQPNIVFVLTDDQDAVLGTDDYDIKNLGSMAAMNRTRQHLMEEGASITNFFVSTTICCPSRTEFLTGRYYHNVGAPGGSCMHVDAEKNVFDTKGSMFGLLQSAGYVTGIFGKVTNDQNNYFCTKKRTDGMSFVSTPCDFNDFYCQKYFNKYENGTTTFDNVGMHPSTYQTAQLGNRSLEWLAKVAQDKDTPFFAYVGPHAPHFPATPAPWIANDVWPELGAPHTANWGVESPDKPQHIRQNPPFNDEASEWMDYHMRDRWHSLISVDEVVGGVVDVLKDAGVLDDTFIFYSSDHGYKLGQWRVGTSKQHIYETDIRVMLLARGPGIAPRTSITQVSGNVDLLPTMLDLAGVDIPGRVDGRSLAAFLITKDNPFYPPVSQKDQDRLAQDWRDQYLIEYKSVGTYYNDHSTIWRPDPKDPTNWKGIVGAGPKSPVNATNCKENQNTGAGNCWFVDSENSNSWKALRIVNKTMDVVYAEYDSSWKFQPNSIQFYEVYDLKKDPYQVNNLYNVTSEEQKSAFHAQLHEYALCMGNNTSPSNCP